jgi:hypothetical protein
MRRLSLVGVVAVVMATAAPLRGQSPDSSARAASDTNPYAHLPHLEFTAQIQPGNPAPNIPRSLFDSLAMPAQVSIMAIVDTTGHIDPRSIRVRSISDPRLELYVRVALAHWRFTPATYLGEPVRSVVEIPFQFRR